MRVASISDPGRVRQLNEDSFYVDSGLGLLMVADGMGGHAGGEVASRIAVSTIAEALKNGFGNGDAGGLIRGAIGQAGEAIRARAQADPELYGMGTTLVLALCRGNSIQVAHLGDSRAYLIHDGAIEQITEDHSLVAQMLKAGQLTAEEAPHFHLRNIVTKSLGGPQISEPDLREVEWAAGDHLLLCSDGLTNMVNDMVLRSLISECGGDLERSCEEAVYLANRNGGRDNITLVLAFHE